MDKRDVMWSLYVDILPTVAFSVMEVIGKLPVEERKGRCGGYFCLGERPVCPPPLLVVAIGNLEQVGGVRREKWFNLAQEKLVRLASAPTIWPQDHVSSWVTRDPARNRWGGGIRTKNYYLAFSGLPELADEAAMLLAACRLKFLTKGEADAIARLSSNLFFLEKEWAIEVNRPDY